MILLNFIKTSGAKTSALFPHLDQRGNTGGSNFSAWYFGKLWIGLFLSFCSMTTFANADQQIDQAIHQHLQSLMNQHAKEQGWKGLRLQLENTPLTNTAQLAPCPGKISVNGGSATKHSRQQLTLACSQPTKGWPIKVSSEMKVFLPVVVSTAVITRGENITAKHIKLEETDISRNNRGFYNNTKQILGMSAKRRVRPNQILTPDLIDAPQLIKRGEKIKIIANRDGISASMPGEALEKGGEGEVIKVKNLSSGKTIEAKVVEAGVVTSTY